MDVGFDLENSKSKKGIVFAFIDASNLHLGVKGLGWALDYKRFFVYLRDKYCVSIVYMFLGYTTKQKSLYRFLERAGYHLEFKPVFEMKDGSFKANCDAEMVLRVMLDYERFDRAIIVTGDGDFYCLVKHLITEDKFEKLIAPDYLSCSVLLKRLVGKRVEFLNDKRIKLAYIKKDLTGT